MTGGSPATRGVSERLLTRYARGGPSFGPVVEAVVGLGYAVVVALLLHYERRAWAVIFVVLAAWRGGMAGVLAERGGGTAWQRAAGTLLNLSAEGIMIVAAAFWARWHEDRPGPLAAGFLAFAGALLLSYARVRIRASAGQDLADGPHGIAAREIRLLVLAVGVATGAVYWTLVIVAVVTHAAVLGHLTRLRATLAG